MQKKVNPAVNRFFCIGFLKFPTMNNSATKHHFATVFKVLGFALMIYFFLKPKK